MIIKNYKNLEIKDTPHKIDVRQLYDKDSAQVMHITLKPGESLKPHKTPVDVFFYILEGKPTVQVGDEKIQCEQDNLIESPKEIVHCISNETEVNARILVVKSPKPTTSAKIL
jgi:mannose-6-phosphate isomerase-like protein (cupin superfamily)